MGDSVEGKGAPLKNINRLRSLLTSAILLSSCSAPAQQQASSDTNAIPRRPRGELAWFKGAAPCPSDGLDLGYACAICDPAPSGSCERECAENVALTCSFLAFHYTFAHERIAEALSLFLKACDLGAASGCEAAGLALEGGIGTLPDQARASELFMRACEMGAGASCKRAADLEAHDSGRRVPARELLLRGCRLGAAECCHEVWIGAGTDPTLRRWAQAGERSLNEEACSAGDKRACRAATGGSDPYLRSP